MAKDTKSDKPAPPKKPLTGFFIYKADNFESTKKENPDAKVTEITKIIAKKWGQIDSDEKAKYDKKHEEAKKNYEKEIAAYEAKHGKVEKKKRKTKATKGKAKGKGKKAAEEDDEEDDDEDEDEDEDEEEAPKKSKRSKK